MQMISEMCYAGVARLLMLGRSIVYNAKNVSGKPVVHATDIDTDIVNIDWPVDYIDKAKIVKIRGKEINAYMDAVVNNFVAGKSR